MACVTGVVSGCLVGMGVATHRDPFLDQAVFVSLGDAVSGTDDLALDLAHDVANSGRAVELDRYRKRGRDRCIARNNGGKRG